MNGLLEQVQELEQREKEFISQVSRLESQVKYLESLKEEISKEKGESSNLAEQRDEEL